MDQAIARMQEIASQLPMTDGLACFNRMYLLVTQAVRAHVADGFFADPDFMGRMDVEFVNRYLAAIDTFRTEPPSAPRAWTVLFSNRANESIAPLQFALAGMNAHINFDLAAALVQTCEALRTEPNAGAHHADFEKINTVLAALEQDVRRSFEDGILLEIDEHFAGIEDLFTNFSILAAREAAWVNTQVLWAIRNEVPLYGAYLNTMDRSVAFAGRALLLPLPKI
jgi:hypothetical protein